MWNPRSAHYASLGLALVVIAVAARDQWFFGDDWAILAPRFDALVMQPHVGHWNLIPALVFPALRNVVGIGSYLPFLALAVLAHLAVAHLIWRVLGRIGVAPWLATLLGALVALLGAGAENILWAFQFGYLGAIALGLAVVLLVDRRRLLWLAVIPLSILAVAFSGTALPVLAAAGVLAWVRHGLPRAIAALGPAAVVYAVWYLLIARAVPSGVTPVDSLADVPAALLFGAAMVGGGLGRLFPFIGLGVVPALAAAVWFVVTVRRGIRTVAAPAYALVIGAVVFAGLTAWSRSSLGLTGAASQRYAYLMIVLLLPALALVLTALWARGRRPAIAVGAGVAALAVFNAALLVLEGQVQAEREATSRAVVLQSREAVLADPEDPALLAAPADPLWAPDLLGRDIVTLDEWGQWPPPPEER
jgi:hypothetical protein